MRFAAFGDMGTVMPLGFEVMQQMMADQEAAPTDKERLGFVFHHGDIAYAGVCAAVPVLNVTKSDEWEYIWDLFGTQIEPLASTVPWMTGVGNHEAWYNWTAFETRYPMPVSAAAEDAGARANFWFEFDYGPVHVISGSSEHNYTQGSPQHTWIATALASPSMSRVSPAHVPRVVVCIKLRVHWPTPRMPVVILFKCGFPMRKCSSLTCVIHSDITW